jgi:hypothetical protein
MQIAFHKLEVIHELEHAKLEAVMVATVAANASLVNVGTYVPPVSSALGLLEDLF